MKTFNRRGLLGGATAGAAAALMPGRLRAADRIRMRVGVVPLLSSGPIYLAAALGLFDKVGLDVEMKFFADGALAIPALVAGELDATVATLNAGLFNAVAKGVPYKLFLDRGIEKPNGGSTTIVVSNKMFEAGVTSVDKFAMLQGKRLSMQALGGIDHYLLARGFQRVGLDPRRAATYSAGLTYPDIIKSIGAGQTDAAQTPVPLAFLAEQNNVGHIIGTGADIEPNAQLACWAMPQSFLANNREGAVRLAMAHTYAARIFNDAAAKKDPAVMKILSDAVKVPVALIEKAAPRWTWFDPDGMPGTQSVLAQADFWTGTMGLVSGTVPKDKLLDLSAAEEAARRLQSANPFG